MTIPTEFTRYRPGRRLLTGLTSALLAAVALLWAWNTLAAGLGGLPEVQFRHGLAAVAAFAAVLWLANVLRPVSPGA
jgi:hypothetical protein